MLISAVVPTRNRKDRLLALLACLNQSLYPIHEVVIVDSSDEQLTPADYTDFSNLNIIYLRSESSVCIQRNKGIRAATGDWIFICDDDVEVPRDYLQQLSLFSATHPESSAMSGLFLQPEKDGWKASYPVTSVKELLLKYIFGLSIWGSIDCGERNFLARRLKQYYKKKGNHLSAAGWPVITELEEPVVTVPSYTLGAALVRRNWLLSAPYDEVLDKHGIGDNYGVIMDLPGNGIQLLTTAFVYHHHEQTNRLQSPLQYYRRVLALDYLIRTRKRLAHIRKIRFAWSLFGNLFIYIVQRNKLMIRPAFKALYKVCTGSNPYLEASRQGQKTAEPML